VPHLIGPVLIFWIFLHRHSTSRSHIKVGFIFTMTLMRLLLASTRLLTMTPRKHIKAVIFDMDGTLLDTETLSDVAIFATLQPFGQSPKQLPWELKKQTLGLPGHQWIPLVLNYAKQEWSFESLPSVDDFWTTWEAKLNELAPEIRACPGAAWLVERLHRQEIPLAIATSSRELAVQKKATNHQKIFSRMQAIVADGHPNVQRGKPAPDIYLEAARQLQVDPADCLVFEDALAGVQAGKAAGCTVVAVPDERWSKQDRILFQEQGGADVVLDSLWQFDGAPFGLDLSMLPN
jgi:HAD superfamily hydrolase (TIGR01509 family)